MPLAFNQISIERDPEDHDREAVTPGSTEKDCAAIIELHARFHAPDGDLLDVACGSGRHIRTLVAAGLHCHGIDIDQRMIDCAQEQAPLNTDDYICANASLPPSTWLKKKSQKYAAMTLLNHSLACFHSHNQAIGLFASVAELLLPGGLFIIDNCCTPMWTQIKEGLFADGLSDDGQEQMIILPGENRFVWRRGDEVDADNWQVNDSDRLYRLWSLNELMLAAAGAGLASCLVEHDTAFLVLKKPETGGINQ